MRLKQTLIFKTMTGRGMADVRSDVHGCAQRHIPPLTFEKFTRQAFIAPVSATVLKLPKSATSVLLNQGDILHRAKTQ